MYSSGPKLPRQLNPFRRAGSRHPPPDVRLVRSQPLPLFEQAAALHLLGNQPLVHLDRSGQRLNVVRALDWISDLRDQRGQPGNTTRLALPARQILFTRHEGQVVVYDGPRTPR